MKSITRRIERLESASLAGSIDGPYAARNWRRFQKSAPPRIRFRFGYLHCLPNDYRGERHRIVTRSLPDQNGQEWVEYEEVPGPAPSVTGQILGCDLLIDVVFVPPIASEAELCPSANGKRS